MWFLGCGEALTPTPLLIVHGTTDTAFLPEKAQVAYDAAAELIETHNHIELYDQDGTSARRSAGSCAGSASTEAKPPSVAG